MDTSKLSKFAPKARKDLQEQVGAKLDYILRADTAELREKSAQVERIKTSVRREGREAYIDRIAYTWFNRLSALRFIDARGYHPFGCRVITAEPGKVQPEILSLALSGGLPPEIPVDLSHINGLLEHRIASSNPQSEVYRHLVLSVCAFYHNLLPFLFDKIDSETELLLPDDLLTPASIAEGFRTEISDEDCSDVEIIGWLYQFYISDKKNEVMARKKAVTAEEIAAVTQLFTPHWVVRYLVENSLGRLWIRSKPNSSLREHMPYFIEEQEGQKHPDSLTISSAEEIKIIDPACGSGHMLTYAFDLLVKIYEEEGYAPNEIPRQILTNNIYGIELCPRATQLAQFALICKAREHSRSVYRKPVKPQISCLRNISISKEEVEEWMSSTKMDLGVEELRQIHQFREDTDCLGSLIQPVLNNENIPALRSKVGDPDPQGDSVIEGTRKSIQLALQQAEMLSQRYHVALANPPYMGRGAMSPVLKEFADSKYQHSKSDLFAMFIERNNRFVVSSGINAMITMQSWMFLSSFEKLREKLLNEQYLSTMAHLGARAFDSIGGEVVQATAFTMENNPPYGRNGIYLRLLNGRNESEKSQDFIEGTKKHNCGWQFKISQEQFFKIPGCRLAYWVFPAVISSFDKGNSIGGAAKKGLSCSNTEVFYRFFWEVDVSKLTFSESEKMKWVEISKGGEFRKWYGNKEYRINWEDEGSKIKSQSGSVVRNESYYFNAGLGWNDISTGLFSCRFIDRGAIPTDSGPIIYDDDREPLIACVLNSKVSEPFLEILCPTIHFGVGQIANFPLIPMDKFDRTIYESLRSAHKLDWDAYERSWAFRSNPLLAGSLKFTPTLKTSYTAWIESNRNTTSKLKLLEEDNNRLFIDAYGLHDEITPEVPIEQITITVNPAYRYGNRLTEEEQWIRFRSDTMEELISYAVGCMMGRYSLDAPGLILADSLENPDAHMSAYLAKVGKSLEDLKFQPDDDGIIPMLDEDWFEDDVVIRFRAFLRATFGDDSLEENLRFLEEAIGKKIRKYFVSNFYKSHVQTYKKRPIYWLFQSPGKSFQALVYLHRYDKDTVNRLLNDYLRPHLDKLRNRQEQLTNTQVSEASSNAERNRAVKEHEKNAKAIKELEEWERDVIFPLAAKRLEIDLDDGVKVNYPKFGKALAKVAGLN